MCVNYPLYNPAIGVAKKISMQIDSFCKLGYDVTYSAYLHDGVAILRKGVVLRKKQINNKRMNNMFRRFYLLKLCIEYLQIEEKYDIGFIRWDAVDFIFLNTLSIMRNKCRFVLMDFHGYYPGYKSKGLTGKYIKYMTAFLGSRMSKYVDLGLTETVERTLFGIKTLPIDTGIDIDLYKPHRYIGDIDELNLISVANERPYHGLDRIINGLVEYYASENKPKKVYLHLVGKLSPETKRIIKNSGLKSIKTYGYLSGDALDNIYSRCNIGLGPLATYRTGGKQGTGIKTKEYFAIGMPYVYAGNELLVPDDYPYVLKISDNGGIIDINMLIHFYEKILRFGNIQKDMRCFAKENFSWDKIFESALKMMGAV